MVDGSFPERPPLPKDLRVFHDVARALTSSLDLDSILGAIMQQMEQFFEPESWSLLIVDEEQQNLYYAVAAGKSSGDRNLRVDFGEGLAGWVAKHGEAVIVSDPGNDPRFLVHSGTAPTSSLRSAICIPFARTRSHPGRHRTAQLSPVHPHRRDHGVSAGAVRLRCDCYTECAQRGTDPGTDHHR